jgi:hypothetical protein
LRNRRRSVGFSALRSIRSWTYLFPNVAFLLGLVRSLRDRLDGLTGLHIPKPVR